MHYTGADGPDGKLGCQHADRSVSIRIQSRAQDPDAYHQDFFMLCFLEFRHILQMSG